LASSSSNFILFSFKKDEGAAFVNAAVTDEGHNRFIVMSNFSKQGCWIDVLALGLLLQSAVTRSTQPYVHKYSVCPFVSFTHYLFLRERQLGLQEDMVLMSSLCMPSLLTVE
jgi:hypothetical protein